MASRAQVTTGLSPERIQPTASPVDTFVTPVAGRDLAQLAGALKEVAPELSSLSDAIGIHQGDEGAAAAAQASLEGAKTYQDMVRKNPSAASSSPFFQQAAKLQFDKIGAQQFYAYMANEIASGGLSDSTDPGAFDTFMQQNIPEWLAKNGRDPNDAAGNAQWAKYAAAYAGTLRESFTAKTGQNLQTQVFNNTHSEVFNTILQGVQGGLDHATIAQHVQSTLDRLYAIGAPMDVARKATTAAILAAATEVGTTDTTVAHDLLSTVKTKNASLLSQAGTEELYQKAQDDILGGAYRKATWAAEIQKRQQEAATNVINHDFTSALIQAGGDPSKIDVGAWEKQFNDAGDSNSAQQVQALTESFARSHAAPSRPDVVQSIFSHIWGVTDPNASGFVSLGDLQKAQKSQNLNLNDFNQLYQELTVRNGAIGLDVDGTLKGSGDTPQKRFDDAIRTYKGMLGFSDFTGAGFKPAAAGNFAATFPAFSSEWQSYLRNGGLKAGPEDQNKWLRDEQFRMEKFTKARDLDQNTSPKPFTTPAGVDWTANKVLSPVQFMQYRTKALNSSFTDQDLQNLYTTYGVHSITDIVNFLTTQGTLLRGTPATP